MPRKPKKLDPRVALQDCQYCVDYEYDTERGDHSNCDSICRCRRITNARVKSVDIDGIIGKMFERTAESKDELLQYCFHRILTHSGVSQPDNWHLHISGGYYGQEVHGASYCGGNEVIEKLNTLLATKSDLQRMFYTLEAEYGYVLDTILDCKSCSIVKIAVKDVIIPQTDHYRRLNQETIAGYANYELPTCVCVEDGGKYRLIDGYHRLFAAKQAHKTSIDVVVLK